MPKPSRPGRRLPCFAALSDGLPPRAFLLQQPGREQYVQPHAERYGDAEGGDGGGGANGEQQEGDGGGEGGEEDAAEFGGRVSFGDGLGCRLLFAL